MISIIVPVYNTAPYLDTCLNSLVSQTYKDIEIILIDDCSTDNSSEIIQKWEKKDNRIKAIYKQKNSGVSDSRNIGLKIARGEYIGFVDSDDWVDINLFQIMLCSIEKNNADISICSTRKMYYDKYTHLLVPKTEKYVSRDDAFLECLCPIGKGYNNMYLWNKLFKKRIFDTFPMFRKDIHYCEDILWVTEAMCLASRVIYCPEAFYYYRCEREGNSSVILNRGIVDPIKAYGLVYKALKRNGVSSANIAYQRMLSYRNIYLKNIAKTGNKQKFKKGSNNYLWQVFFWFTKEKSLYAFKWSMRRFVAYYYYAFMLYKNIIMSKISAIK